MGQGAEAVSQSETRGTETFLKFVTVAAFFLAGVTLQSCSNPSTNTGQTSSQTTGVTTSPGLKAYKDPVTGKFGPPPAGVQSSLPSATIKNRQSTTSVLKEVPIPGIGGGTMVDLKGQFRKDLIATKDANGKITITHAPGTAGSSEKGN